MVARTRPPTFRVLAAWEPSSPPHRPAPRPTSAALPRVVLSTGPVTRLTLRMEPTALTLYRKDGSLSLPGLEFSAAIALPPMDLAPPPAPPPAPAETSRGPIVLEPPDAPPHPTESTGSRAEVPVLESAIPDTTPEYLEPLTVMADEPPPESPAPEKQAGSPLVAAELPAPPSAPPDAGGPPTIPTPGLYDLPALLARILSVSAGLRAAGEMRLGVREAPSAAPPSPSAAPGPELATSVGASNPAPVPPEAPATEESPAPPAPILAALPVFQWRDWHRPASHAHDESRAEPAPQAEVVSYSRSTARREPTVPATTPYPPAASTCRCPQCYRADPPPPLRGVLARRRHLRFEYSSAISKPHPPPEESDEPGGLVPLARPARYRWRMYRDRLEADSKDDG